MVRFSTVWYSIEWYSMEWHIAAVWSNMSALLPVPLESLQVMHQDISSVTLELQCSAVQCSAVHCTASLMVSEKVAGKVVQLGPQAFCSFLKF